MNRVKELLLVLSILLYVTTCTLGTRARGDSSTLTRDLRESTGYQEATRIFNTDRNSLEDKAGRALDEAIKAIVSELKKRKHTKLARDIESQYAAHYRGFIPSIKAKRDVGDHEAIAWLKSVHDKVHDLLGDKNCRATRLHDIWILAHTIPVVFACIDNVDYPEYYKHYSPFLGVVAYWISYGTCAVASGGAGLVTFCGLIANGCEGATIQLIAPITANSAHDRACN